MHRASVCAVLLALWLAGCGGESQERDLYEIVPTDVVLIGGGDSRTPPGDAAPQPDVVTATDLASELPLPVDLVEVSDLTLQDLPSPDDLPSPPDVQDIIEPPDLQVPDMGTVDAGPCGQCPAEAPMCQDGECVCTGTSCPGGFYCKGGDCTPCNNDIHCGVECVSCASQGKYCHLDGSHCVDCDANHPCPPGKQCLEGECTDCEALGLCGPNCVQCTDQMPDCVDGACACNETSCGAAAVCEAAVCVPCTDSDPDHCGPDCLVCSGETPHCGSGLCTLCALDDQCGPTCQPCGGQTPHCRPDGVGCVACLEDPDCSEGFSCLDFECIEDCFAPGCQSDLSKSGKKCAEAYVVGRLEAVGTFTITENNDNQSNDDDLNYFFGHSECWDAGYDQHYRIYLRVGETITVTLTPQNEPEFDAMLKLFTGTECDKDSAGFLEDNDDFLVQCWNDGSDGEAEGFTFTAGAEGWYTVVVDGRQAGDAYDYGDYLFTLKLSCTEENCCCP